LPIETTKAGLVCPALLLSNWMSVFVRIGKPGCLQPDRHRVLLLTRCVISPSNSGNDFKALLLNFETLKL
jgi:hypothetical protein